MLRGDQKRVRACGPLAGQRQHLRAEGRDDDARARDAGLIELVEVLHQGGVGAAVSLPGRLWMADADAQQETAGVRGVDAVERGGDGRGVVGPDVHDPRGHDQRRGCDEQILDHLQVAAGGSAEPYRAESQGLDVTRQLRCDRVLAAEDPVGAQQRPDIARLVHEHGNCYRPRDHP
jgi:hypothetical protein